LYFFASSKVQYLKLLPTDGPTVIQGPAEDAGILKLTTDKNGCEWGLVFGHESHNHPSQVVPYEGAATGIGGILRDVICMGSEVVAVADPLRFGSYKNQNKNLLAIRICLLFHNKNNE
jgi:phosphoribosylformylglycinamidine synthase